MSSDEMIRLSETLGRIDGKLDEMKASLTADRERQDGRLADHEGRIRSLEMKISRFIGWAVGAGVAGSAAAQALTKLGLFHL